MNKEPTPEAVALVDKLRKLKPNTLTHVHWHELNLFDAALEIDRFAAKIDDEPMIPVREFLECALYDALMEGPKFRGWNLSALDRLRKECEDRND